MYWTREEQGAKEKRMAYNKCLSRQCGNERVERDKMEAGTLQADENLPPPCAAL